MGLATQLLGLCAIETQNLPEGLVISSLSMQAPTDLHVTNGAADGNKSGNPIFATNTCNLGSAMLITKEQRRLSVTRLAQSVDMQRIRDPRQAGVGQPRRAPKI